MKQPKPAVRVRPVDSLVINLRLLDTGVPVDVIFNGERITVVRTQDDVIEILADIHKEDKED